MRWVIGDIHGMFGGLETLLDLISRRDHNAKFVFVGDYVNRGPDSKRVIDLLLSLNPPTIVDPWASTKKLSPAAAVSTVGLSRNKRTRKPPPKVVGPVDVSVADSKSSSWSALEKSPVASFCRGNHDDVLDLILHEHWEGGEDNTYEALSAAVWFLKYGLVETCLSYGIEQAEIEFLREHPSDRLLQLIRQAVPDRHKAFVRSLKMYFEMPDLFVCHAYWPIYESNDPGHVAERTKDAAFRHRMIWERYKAGEIVSEKPAWTRPAFFGHTPTQNYPGLIDTSAEPIGGPQVTLVDTAYALGTGGRLTAVCVEDGRVVQVNRSLQTFDSVLD